MNQLPEPLTPADCDLRDFAFMPLDVKRMLSSETWILGTGDERAAAITLWLESWHQVPAASLPDNDRMLDHLSKAKAWKRVKEHALRGWVKCSDGRLYHSVVAEKVLEAWIEKLLNSLSGSAGNAKRWGVEVDTDAISIRVVEAASLLKLIAPQSKTLRKKQVVSIVVGSPPEKKTIAPRSEKQSPPESPPESPGDRKGQGQGQGYIKPLGTVVVGGTSARSGTDDFTPKDPAEWLRHFRMKHGFEADPSNVNDRKKLWPVFSGWINAGLSASFVDAAVAVAISRSREPIANLPLYVDRLMASEQAARASPTLNARDESRKRAAEVLTNVTMSQSHEPPNGTVIDVDAKLLG